MRLLLAAALVAQCGCLERAVTDRPKLSTDQADGRSGVAAVATSVRALGAPNETDTSKSWTTGQGSTPPAELLLQVAWQSAGEENVSERCYYSSGGFFWPLDMPGHGRTSEASIEACQARCAHVDGCAYFTYYRDHGCHITGPDAVRWDTKFSTVCGPKKWPERCFYRPRLVAAMFTFGAPAVAHPALSNPGNACIPGVRTYNENSILPSGGIGRQVDAAAIFTWFPHAITPTLVLHQGSDPEPSTFEPCPGRPEWPQNGPLIYADWGFHFLNFYWNRLRTLHFGWGQQHLNLDEVPHLISFQQIADFPYAATVELARQQVREKEPTLRLVAYVPVKGFGFDVDRVLIVQNPKNWNCVIAFQGSGGLEDLASFVTAHGTGFCGFRNTHAGIRNELWTLANDAQWGRIVKPTLAQCPQVVCAGHSLGGALCELFTACANTGYVGNPDYDALAWSPGTPALMPWV